ncbi:hypothetical protein ACXYTP_25160 [Tsukamurella ocularis]
MADPKFKLDTKGGEEVLKQLAASTINTLAQQVAAQAGPDADVQPYTTDRAAAAVSVPADQQAVDGVLTRAASAAGLEVRLK